MKTRLNSPRVVGFMIAGAIAAYGVVGGLVAPPIAKKLLVAQLSGRLGRAIEVDGLAINPYTLRTTIKGFRVFEPDGKALFASFDVLDANGSAASIYHVAPVVDALTLTGLKIHLIRDTASHYNMSDILERFRPAAPPVQKGGKVDEPARFSVGNIRVVNASIDFDDRPNGATQRISEIQITIPSISNLPTHLKDQVQPRFSANVNGAPLTLSGEAKPFEDTITTHFNIGIRALDIPHYLAYLPADLPVKVDTGRLDADVSLHVTQAPGKPPKMDLDGTAALDDISLSTGEGTLARFKRLEAAISSLDPIGGVVKVASVRLADAAVMQGRWTFPSVEARGINVDLEKHAVRVESVTGADGRLAVRRNADGTFERPHILFREHDPGNAADWNVALAKLLLTGYAITVVDATVKPAVTHHVVVGNLEADDLTNEGRLTGRATAALRLDKNGLIDASSTFSLDPLLIKATMDARAIDLVPFRAYASQFPTVALKSGSASAKGTVLIQQQGDAVLVRFAGATEIANLATLDTIANEELLDWKSVRCRGIALNYAPDAPLDLAVSDVTVDRAYSRIVVTPEGKLNVQQLRTATPEQPQGPAAPDAPPPRNVRIDRIAFVDSQLNFTDHYIKPNYTADVREVSGSVVRLSSEPASRATVALNGRWDATSPVVIAGTANPLSGSLFLDIAAKGEDIDLTKVSAYSQRYAGYGITAGRLSLDVKYRVENGKLEGRNKILIDALTFGEKVESPDATKLPVLFAVNLLKDSKGRINLELPISGSLDDPKFELGPLIVQVLTGHLGKAETSPFSLLAAEAGGDDLAFVEFEPGLAGITPAAETKLETLVRVLQDRPGLKLEVAARVDPGKDVEALRTIALQRKLASAPKDLSNEARERLAQEPIVVGRDELDALSLKRADQVRAYLIARDRLAPERVLVASSPAGSPTTSKGQLSRVDFTLR